MKHFFSVHDVDSIDEQIALALELKQDPLKYQNIGKNKRIGIIFLNPSLRTRLSTIIAAENLGMSTIVLNMSNESWALEFDEHIVMNGSKVENIADAAPILGQYFDILALRTFPELKNRDEDYSELVFNQFIKHAGIPIISLESATLHPLQSLADAMTISEFSKTLNKKPKVVLTWAPHVKALPQCVANSFSQWMTVWDKVDFTIAHPAGFELNEQFTHGATITHDQDTAIKDADFIYVKNWSSYQNYGGTSDVHNEWMLDNNKLCHNNSAKIMHCLPVRRNVEISHDLLESDRSLVQQQAGNRIWAAQSVIFNILKNK